TDRSAQAPSATARRTPTTQPTTIATSGPTTMGLSPVAVTAVGPTRLARPTGEGGVTTARRNSTIPPRARKPTRATGHRAGRPRVNLRATPTPSTQRPQPATSRAPGECRSVRIPDADPAAI